ncbi:21946_t:CDS:1, partial [Racocetra persica]
MNYLKRHGIENDADDNLNSQDSQKLTLRFMPLPNMTRWNSWLKMVIYVYDYLEYIKGFYLEEHKSESNETIKDIISVFNDRNENELIEIYLAFIRFYSCQFMLDTDFFQKEREPIFSLIELRIQQLKVFLMDGMTATHF